MIKWERPSGSVIETNEEPATILYAESQGWKRVEDKPKRSTTVKKAKDERDSKHYNS